MVQWSTSGLPAGDEMAELKNLGPKSGSKVYFHSPGSVQVWMQWLAGCYVK
ncbi:hypothetical protein Taro_031708 [Colocasia esculenta]|uniref:Uncharacterized protein n=1 Tax=Colocasia esculenta TaxID=4460 RepID=A0A843VJI0_COLES|nr:hypothetical protein [Colocasia esculenta]